MAQSPVNAAVNLLCSICLDETSDICGRTVVTLQCSHKFHLDCIGSAFNVSGIMQCPNCRNIENGEWLRFEEVVQLDSDMDTEEEQEQILEMVHAGDDPTEHWCPFHGRVMALPVEANRDAQVPSSYTTNNHQPVTSRVPGVSVTNTSMNHLNRVHVPYVPDCDHVSANRAPVRPNWIARQEYAGVLPYNRAVNHHIIVQPRNRYNGMQSMQGALPGRYVSASVSPQRIRNFYHVPHLNLNVHNNHTHHAIHDGHVLNPTISNSHRTGPVYYFAPSINEANGYRIFEHLPDSIDPYWDQLY